jgi:hypothetical protein
VKIPDLHCKAFFLESLLKHCKTFFLAGTPFTATTLWAPAFRGGAFRLRQKQGA